MSFFRKQSKNLVRKLGKAGTLRDVSHKKIWMHEEVGREIRAIYIRFFLESSYHWIQTISSQDLCVWRPESLGKHKKQLIISRAHSNVYHHCCLYGIIFEITRLNLIRLHYFATVTRLDCHMSKEFLTICIWIQLQRHVLWITIHPKAERHFRNIVIGNCGIMIFQEQSKTD